MSNILLRGFPKNIRRWIHQYAHKENYSVNQSLLRLIHVGLKEREEEMMGKPKDVFRRIDELREELFRQHGLFEDSAKLIREDRESH